MSATTPGSPSIVEQRLRDHGVELPPAPAPVAAYVPFVQTGSLVLISGQLPTVGKEVMFTGKIGREVPEEDAPRAARLAALNALAQLKAAVGSLDRVQRIVRLEGYVQAVEGFHRQPVVVNGASELMIQAFGDAGRHTRIAVGASDLPLNACVEIALWAEVRAE